MIIFSVTIRNSLKNNPEFHRVYIGEEDLKKALIMKYVDLVNYQCGYVFDEQRYKVDNFEKKYKVIGCLMAVKLGQYYRNIEVLNSNTTLYDIANYIKSLTNDYPFAHDVGKLRYHVSIAKYESTEYTEDDEIERGYKKQYIYEDGRPYKIVRKEY